MNLRFRNRKHSSALTDEDLISLYKIENNKNCIGELFSRYSHLVYGICLDYLKDDMAADDAVMEVFEELYKKLHVYDIESFKNWLYSVTKNKCLGILRRNKLKVENRHKIKAGLYPEDTAPEPKHSILDDAELFIRNKLTEALTFLKKEQYLCIKLMYFEDCSYKEISEKTGLALGKVKSNIQNGKRNLKLYINRNEKGC